MGRLTKKIEACKDLTGSIQLIEAVDNLKKEPCNVIYGEMRVSREIRKVTAKRIYPLKCMDEVDFSYVSRSAMS